MKVVLECFGGFFFRGFFVRYVDKFHLRVLYARLYNTNILVITLAYFLRKMAVAHVVFIDYIAVF